MGGCAMSLVTGMVAVIFLVALLGGIIGGLAAVFLVPWRIILASDKYRE